MTRVNVYTFVHIYTDTKSHTASSDHPKEVARDTEQFYENFVVCDKAIEKPKTLSFSAKIKSVVVTLAGMLPYYYIQGMSALRSLIPFTSA